MTLAILAIIVGIAVLVWSADKFVDGSAAIARYLGLSPLLIGMVIVGFGTSAPEMVVSAFSALEGNPGIALGNAYGSNIANIALILGLSAVLNPIKVNSQVIRKELPILTGVTALAIWQVCDGHLGRTDALVLLVVFAGLMILAVTQARRQQQQLQNPQVNPDALLKEMEQELEADHMSPKKATFWIVVGLILVIASSRLLVWAAVEVAHAFGVSDLIIGLTIVAVGTSLPELASSVAAARKGEHDIALGNILGSNLFNTLVVVGIAGMIKPMDVMPEICSRDMVVMAALTVSLFAMGYGFRGPGTGRINRFEGGVLLASFFSYVAYLVGTATT